MAYTILRFAKHKGNPARAIQAHHEREKEKYKSNPDIKVDKIKNNIHLVTPTASYKVSIIQAAEYGRTAQDLLIHSLRQVLNFSKARP